MNSFYRVKQLSLSQRESPCSSLFILSGDLPHSRASSGDLRDLSISNVLFLTKCCRRNVKCSIENFLCFTPGNEREHGAQFLKWLQSLKDATRHVCTNSRLNTRHTAILELWQKKSVGGKSFPFLQTSSRLSEKRVKENSSQFAPSVTRSHH